MDGEVVGGRVRLSKLETLSEMLQLTPLKETKSFQEALHEDRVEMLTKQIRHKFRFAESTIEKLTARLRVLTMVDLEALYEVILDLKTLRDLNAWLDERLPETEQNEINSQA